MNDKPKILRLVNQQGHDIDAHIKWNEPVAVLKDMAARWTGIPIDEIRLFYYGNDVEVVTPLSLNMEEDDMITIGRKST